jgi:hypothetical protein
MSEQALPNQSNGELEVESPKNENVSKTKNNKNKINQKKTRSKDDYYVIMMPERLKSLSAKIANRIIEVLREEPLLSEKEIILKLIARDNEIKEYFSKTHDISYIKFVIWELVKKRLILKAKILGDDKHVYFFLPEQIDKFREKIIKAPKESSD